MPGDRTLLDRIKEIESLPTPPLVFTAINRVINDPKASAYDVASIVSEDAGIAARILRMANSAYYGLPQPVSSIRQAIIILGMDSLRSLVLSVSLMDAFATSPLEREYQDLIWRHSLATASAARLFFCSRFSEGSIRGCEEGFAAGLLHDIGKMILACHLPAERARVRSDPGYGVVEDRLVEMETIGVTHEEIGTCLAERWELPLILRAAIRHHHDLNVTNPDHRLLARVIHVADYLAHAAAPTNLRGAGVLPAIDPETYGEFRLDDQTMAELVSQVRDDFGRAETFLEMARSA
jgi:HD-like signal output (HDOD) protein